MEHPCGRCLSCRINRRRLWTTRLVLESFLHKASLFVTLTYSDEHLPAGGDLVPRDFKLFLMRLRTALGRSFRYFGCGEYGEKRGRPHYHVLLFGVGEVDLVAKCWSLGHVHAGTVTAASAAYTTGYCTKGWTRKGDPRLAGRHPEFVRMSLKPGIGAGAIPELARAARAGASRYLEVHGDVPRQVRFAGKKQDIGRYLADKLRVALDRPKGLPEVQRGVVQLNFWTKMKDAALWAEHLERRRRDVHKASRIERETRKVLL